MDANGPAIKKVRQEIDYNWDEFKGIVQSKKFKAAFGDLDRSGDVVLKRMPKGYPEDHPAIEYLKFKSLIVSTDIPDKDLLSKDLAKKVSAYFETMKPFIYFLNEGLEE